MFGDHVNKLISDKIGADSIEVVEEVQALWSGYGMIYRVQVHGGSCNSLIVKHIKSVETGVHPRGWNTSISHQRKLKSYQVERYWYENYTGNNEAFKTPSLIAAFDFNEEQFIVLEDLNDAGFRLRKQELQLEELLPCVEWLAKFHGSLMGVDPKGLWKVGTYWHLETRPDEWSQMDESELKGKAHKIDEVLSGCKFQTIVHGDAKVANFCFNEKGEVAGLDFQYIGGGCGMKDLIYLMGSCLSEENCFQYDETVLKYYFSELQKSAGVKLNELEFRGLEKEWRRMYSYAWADFSRFLLGWMPSHKKLNKYSQEMVEQVLRNID